MVEHMQIYAFISGQMVKYMQGKQIIKKQIIFIHHVEQVWGIFK